jgi:hypothetical protein
MEAHCRTLMFARAAARKSWTASEEQTLAQVSWRRQQKSILIVHGFFVVASPTRPWNIRATMDFAANSRWTPSALTACVYRGTPLWLTSLEN